MSLRVSRPTAARCRYHTTKYSSSTMEGGGTTLDDVSIQSQVNVDDLKRSGRIAMWPYIMRELPLSPVEALRFELQLKTAGEPDTSDNTRDSAEKLLHRGFVHYFPARLADDRRETGSSETERLLHGPRADSDLDALTAKPVKFEHQHLDILSRKREGYRSASRRRARSTDCSPIHHAKPLGRRRPSSGGHQRPQDLRGGVDINAAYNVAGDRTECPLGCGEEVRLRDLVPHQASVCPFRYVDCLVPGCGKLVQANKMSVHLRQQCLARKMRCSMAAKAEMAKLEISCGACGSLVPQESMRSHIANDCGMRTVTCRRPGCGQAITALSSHEHEIHDCAVAKRHAAFVEHAARRPRTVECPECRATIPTGSLRGHAASECCMRIVACPNANLGCGDELRAADMKRHLREECWVQLDRTERASRHKVRLERVRCSGCGYTVSAQHLLKHQREKCPNRLVPCKHRELGCPAMLRLSAMNDHLCVDRLLDARSCLAFDSGRAYIALDEEDRKPPWTVEMWIWRPGLVEGTREKARTALKSYWEFQQCREKLAIGEHRLKMLEPLLVAAATRCSQEKTQEAEHAREKLLDEMVAAATLRDDAKVGLVVASVVLSNTLAAAIRGVEEITRQNRLRGFDRLALASTPWYAVVPDMKGGGGDDKVRKNGEWGDSDIKLIKTLQSDTACAILQPSDLGAPTDSSGPVDTRRETLDEPIDEDGMTVADITLPQDEKAEHNDPHPEDVREAPLSVDGIVDTSAPGKSTTLKYDPLLGGVADDKAPEGGSRDPAVSDGTQENVETATNADELFTSLEATQQAAETALGEKEALFWAEWVALNGASLAERMLHLSGETLPKLKEEVVNVTGLADDLIFRTCSETNQTDKVDDGKEAAADGVAVNDDSTISTTRSAKKSAARKAARKARRKRKHEQQFGKKLETRIAEEVNKRGGVETLFGSDNVLFQLEMGPKDRVGIKVAGKTDEPFNYRCPRERWVHLAFVSDSTGVFLLENGKTASRLGGVTVPLPMRHIGGRETACQALIQEVRYWKVKRSKQELEGCMHQVLPASAVEDGLLGYWTFEEGAGDYVNDVTGQRFRSKKVGRGLKWVRPELMCTFKVGEPPTPSWREQNVCKVELRHGRLANRGRLHRQFVSCPAGCGESLLRKTVGAHLAYRCNMRMVPCSMAACGKRVKAKDLERHLQERCESYKEWQRMASAGQENQEEVSCPYCTETVKKCNLKVHVKYVCQWAKVPCRNAGCGARIPRLRLAEHEKRFCEAASAVRRRRRLARARARSKYHRQWAQDEE